LEQIQIKYSQVSIKFKFRSEFYFSSEYGWPLVKSLNTKVVPNILIYLHAKFHIFLRSLNIFSHLILSYWIFHLEKEYKLEHSSRAIFLHTGLLLQHPGSTQRMKRRPVTAPAPPSLTAETHLSGHLPPNPPLLRARVPPLLRARVPPLLCACVSSPVSSPPLSRSRVNSFSPQCCHMCAYTLEPSRHLLCSVASGCCWPPVPTLAVAAPVGCRCQPLEDGALEQPASLAELPMLKAHRLD
jgi:hypothetical protein